MTWHRRAVALVSGTLCVWAGCQTKPPAETTESASVLHYLEQTLWIEGDYGRVTCAYEVLGQDTLAATVETYVWAACGDRHGGVSTPVVLVSDSSGRIERHLRPRDGGAYSRDLEVLFPRGVRARVRDFDAHATIVRQRQEAQGRL